MRYDKLVRDRIPDIIRAKNQTAVMHVADEAEYWIKLKEKLREEVDEFCAAENLEELADVMEVILAIQAHKGFDPQAVEAERQAKADKRGGFVQRLILEES